MLSLLRHQRTSWQGLCESESGNKEALRRLGQVCALVSALCSGCGVLLDPLWILRTWLTFFWIASSWVELMVVAFSMGA